MTKMKATLEFSPMFKEMPYKVVKIVGTSPVIDTSKPNTVGIGSVKVGERVNEAQAKILGGFAELTTVLAGRTK